MRLYKLTYMASTRNVVRWFGNHADAKHARFVLPIEQKRTALVEITEVNARKEGLINFLNSLTN